jgi:hypothetical protein
VKSSWYTVTLLSHVCGDESVSSEEQSVSTHGIPIRVRASSKPEAVRMVQEAIADHIYDRTMD